ILCKRKPKVPEIRKDTLSNLKMSMDEKSKEKDEAYEKPPTEKDSEEMCCLPEGVSRRCQWRRDLEYATKGGTCDWTQKFERTVKKTIPYPNFDVADGAMRKAIDDLYGKAW
ncbi:hypothetical protein NPIL_154781, partial [Nephila pilipes]